MSVCPGCGRCRECGHHAPYRAYPYQPYQPYRTYQPYWWYGPPTNQPTTVQGGNQTTRSINPNSTGGQSDDQAL